MLFWVPHGYPWIRVTLDRTGQPWTGAAAVWYVDFWTRLCDTEWYLNHPVWSLGIFWSMSSVLRYFQPANIQKNTGMPSGKRPWQWSYPMLRHARRTQDSLSGSLLSIKYWNLFKKMNRVGQTLDYEPLWPEYLFLQGFIRVLAKCYFTSDGFRIAYRPPSFLLGFTRVPRNSSHNIWRGTASGPIRILRFCFVL